MIRRKSEEGKEEKGGGGEEKEDRKEGEGEEKDFLTCKEALQKSEDSQEQFSSQEQ